MGYLVADQTEISVFIADKEYPLEAINLMNWMHISTTFRHDLPMLGMQIVDVQRVFDRIGLIDGTPIRVVIKSNGKDSQTYVFRKFNAKTEFNGASYVWSIYGYWDAPLYWAASSLRAIEGTSNAVLQEIAQTCGLKFNGVSTNDSQIWVPRNRTYRSWAKDITDHAWSSDKSCMNIGVDLDGTMVFKDMNNLPEPEQKILGYTFAKDALTASDIQVSASSGLNNALTGYQNMRISQSATQDEMQRVIKDLVFKPDVKNPLYNQELKDKLGRGAVRFGPIDCGNFHDNYDKAAYQNLRYRNMFSLNLEALMIDAAKVKLGSRVNLGLQTEDTGQDVPNSGVYTITGHAIYTQGANYAEKLGMARHGVNEVKR